MGQGPNKLNGTFTLTMAAEAQESLEKESLTQVEIDVRAELAKNLHGEEEQLDGTGVDLPSLFKWIESQIPNGCSA
ncbi:hypothetical protein IFM89_019836 [Coptis chinensis]|uniref:Uncharacterized protein n=1 Tax=Coptis chinensis TaxID=261450 RepID=A0A835M040_9MAGN|nr:hypothetical protein IFM89_019836 [Coptis chinensis]